MQTWLNLGTSFSLLMVLLIVLLRGRERIQGVQSTSTWVFIAILFTSGLDVGLIMFPLTEFPVYANTAENPEYAFANPLAIEFGFWGFLVWAIYFLTCFYFCAIEPTVRFFEHPIIKVLNNVVIIGTCAFTAYLLFANLPWYVPLGDTAYQWLIYSSVVATAIVCAVLSSTDIRFVTILSVSSGALFLLLLLGLAAFAILSGNAAMSDFVQTPSLVVEYFKNIHQFVFAINDYHAFYLFWWFSWSIMIGQFTSRFVSNTTVAKLLLHMLCWPSLAIALWFSVLFVFFQNQIETAGLINSIMVLVGIVFVINSLDSLIRLYSDNLSLSVSKLGAKGYFATHTLLLGSLTLLFSLDFLKIQWVGALVIGLLLSCGAFLYYRHIQKVAFAS